MTVLVELYPHQKVCRQWLVDKEQSQKGGVVSLDMGLGKTMIAFSMIDENDALPTIIFCPVGLLHQWKFECEDKTNLRCLIYHGKARKGLMERLLNEAGDSKRTNVILASFGSAKDSELQSLTYHRIIVDEIHYMRNINTILFKELCRYNANYRIGLTGTPLVNGAQDLFSYCLFIKILDMPPRFASNAENTRSEARYLNTQLKKQFAFRLDRGLLHQVMIQMNLADCNLDVGLTSIYEHRHQLILDEPESTIYKRFERRAAKAIDQEALQTGLNQETNMMLLSYIVYLRQSSNNLYLVRAQLANDPDYTAFLESALPNGPPGKKTQKCIELIQEVPNSEKVIVFSEFLGMMSILGNELKRLEIPYLFYVGGMTLQERTSCIDQFRNHEGKIVLIAMKQCISVGLNLTDANHAILLSEWFNTTLDRQSIARIHRLGQRKPVHVHRLMSLSTIDERIHAIATKKEDEIRAVSGSIVSELDKDRYLRQTSLADYGFLLNLNGRD